MLKLNHYAILAALLGSPAVAVTLPPYTPGGAPCAGACSLPWALAQTGAPEGDPVPMTLRAGAVIDWMSYAKLGVPYSTTKDSFLTSDQSGVGYWFEDINGDRKLMFKLDECQNWSIVRVPVTIDTSTPGIEELPVAVAWPGEWPWLNTFPDYWQGGGVCCEDGRPPDIPPPPAPVPLPWSALLLSAALLFVRATRQPTATEAEAGNE